MTTVFMFPGQSSRDPAMFQRLACLAPETTATALERASDVLGRDLARNFHPENRAMFERNQDVQVGVFLANSIFLDVLQQAGVDAELSAGLSLGEYNHLVHIGALDFEVALRLVDSRGACYDRGPRGMMASVFPIALEELEEVVRRVAEHGIVEIANFNSPAQFVLSGETRAVEAATAILAEEYYVEPVVIEQHVPMHASIFEPAAVQLRPALEAAAWLQPAKPYLPNVLGRFVDAPSVDLLARHVYQPVLWWQSIDLIVELHPDAVFIEVGPRAVLYNLLRRDWHANRKFKTDAAGDIARSFDALLEELLVAV